MPSHVTPGSLAQSCHFSRNCQSSDSWSSYPVMTLLVLLASPFIPGSLPGEFLSSIGEFLSPSRVTPGALAQSCQFLNSCPSHVTHGALDKSCHFSSICTVMSPHDLVPCHVTPGARAQSCHSWSSCPFPSILERLPSHVTT